MRTLDFSPFYRSTVGFDRLFTMLDNAGQTENSQSYPPYDIERTGENSYCISMAVAGFSDKEISIESHCSSLTISGERLTETDNKQRESEVLYRGIASRSFTRCFQLADHVEVAGAVLENGLLRINLKRNIPEKMKPRKIPIVSTSSEKIQRIEAACVQ